MVKPESNRPRLGRRRSAEEGGRHRSAAGRAVSLLEVMVALALLATAFFAVVSGLPALFDAQLRSEQMALAAAAGQRLLGQVRAREFSELRSLSGSVRLPAVSRGVSREEEYGYQVDVLPVADNLKDVTATVSWSYRGQSHELVLQTRVFGDAGGRL